MGFFHGFQTHNYRVHSGISSSTPNLNKFIPSHRFPPMLRLLRSKLLSHLKPPNPIPPHLHTPLATNSTAAAATTSPPSLTVHFLIHSCGLSPTAAETAAERLHLKNTRNPHAVISLLRSYGFEKADVTRLISRRPALLLASPENTLRPKLDFYLSVGLSISSLAPTLSSCPTLLLWSLHRRMLPSYSVLQSILDSQHDLVLTAINRCPRLLTVDLHKLLLPNIQILKDHGIPATVITKAMTTHPKSLMSASFDETFAAVKQMGIPPTSLTFAHALGVFSRLRSVLWEKKVEKYLSLGWLREDVMTAFARHPYCMSVSDDKIEKNMDFYEKEYGWGPAYLTKYPVLLSLSFDKRILPRCEVLRALALKGLLKGEVRASHLMMAQKDFLEKYVVKYQEEVPQLFEAIRGMNGLIEPGKRWEKVLCATA